MELLSSRRWRHPGDRVLRRVLPWFEDPLDFLTSVEEMRRESRALERFADHPRESELFRVVRGSTAGTSVDLPWLDVERAFLIAVNRMADDDVVLALDYRGDPVDPRVVGSDVWSNPRQYGWRIAASTFSSFAGMLGLTSGEADGPASA